VKNGYDRALVERLLPAVWDKTFAYGMADPSSPDPEMPRAKPDPKVGGTIFAHLADINIAWDRAEVPPDERRALYLRYGLDWTVKEIGFNQDCDKGTASRRCERGVGRLVSYLTGEAFYDDELVSDEV
jgi:DNA-directed RNA polymerase specialized sigma24 family protein